MSGETRSLPSTAKGGKDMRASLPPFLLLQSNSWLALEEASVQREAASTGSLVASKATLLLFSFVESSTNGKHSISPATKEPHFGSLLNPP